MFLFDHLDISDKKSKLEYLKRLKINYDIRMGDNFYFFSWVYDWMLYYFV